MAGLLLLSSAVLTPEAAAAPSKWVVDAAASRLGFAATQMGTTFEGRFPRFDADVAFASDDLAASRVAVTIDMAGADTGNRERDGLLPGAAWFNVAAHPQARFETTGFQSLGGNRYEVRANLTIRGKTKAVTVPVTIDVTGDTARVEGATTIIRTDFDIGTGEWANPAVVGLNVEVRFFLSARREG